MIKVGSIVRRKLHGTLKYRVAEITPDGCGPGGATARLTVVDDVWNIRDRHEWVDNLVLAEEDRPEEFPLDANLAPAAPTADASETRSEQPLR